MGKESFIDLINDPKELNRILDNYIFKENPNIKNFEEFTNAFNISFDSEKGENAGLTSDKIVKFFETSECKRRIKDNTTDEEFDNLYGDGNKVERIAISEKRVVTIVLPKIESKGYSRKGKPISKYSRTKPRKFTPVETKFLQVRKVRKVPAKQIIKQYEQHFSKNPRTSSSLKSKLYRS